MATDTEFTLDSIRLVLGIARLGESDLRGWWRGHGMDKTGKYVLSGMFRRTWRPAALELDVLAAGKIHDELLGRSTALHLFSDLLPFRRWALGWLAEQKTVREPDPLLTTLEAWAGGDPADTVRTWCGTTRTSGEQIGDGLHLGRLSAAEIADPVSMREAVRMLAAAYVEQIGPLRPPYFDRAR
jgi:hypothetical protein